MYGWYWPQAFHDGLKAEGETEVIMLPRAGYAGSWRWGAALWSGDIQSTFASLRTQVQTGLSAQISGIAWWNADIGGYHNGNSSDPQFRELIVRWFQYGMTCPLFRQHGSGRDTAVWAYGAEDERILGDIIRLRASLKGYVLRELQKTSDVGRPLNRPLWWDYPGDAQAWRVDDAYMFGDDYLAAPVLHAGARSRSVYLPKGSWMHHYTSKVYEGGRNYDIPAPLDSFPLFKKA